MTPHEYHHLPIDRGVSHSMLERYQENPFAFWVSHICKLGMQSPPTDEMALGTLLDCLIFSPKDSLQQVEEIRRIKGEKKFAKLDAKARALWGHFNGYFGNYARSILYAQPWGEFQRPLFWTDDNGTPRKGLMDFISNDGKTIADLKTVGKLERFPWNVERLGYYRQAADYVNGALANDYQASKFLWVVVETSFPWRVRVYEADWQKIAKASLENAENAKDLWKRIKSKDWNFEQTAPEPLGKPTEPTFLEESY